MDTLKKMIHQSLYASLGNCSTECDDWASDVAIKLYFFPLSAILFTDEEWKDLIEEDGLTVKYDKVAWVQDQIALRLDKLVQEMDFIEIHLSVIVYGINASDRKSHDFLCHISSDFHDEPIINELTKRYPFPGR